MQCDLCGKQIDDKLATITFKENHNIPLGAKLSSNFKTEKTKNGNDKFKADICCECKNKLVLILETWRHIKFIPGTENGSICFKPEGTQHLTSRIWYYFNSPW